MRISRFYPLTFLVVLFVAIICLIPIPDPPLKDVPLIDKWTHMALFGGVCSVVLFELTLNGLLRTPCKWIAPVESILYGGLIEIMQSTLTTCRFGDWWDFVADAIGVAIAFPIAYLVCHWIEKRYGLGKPSR